MKRQIITGTTLIALLSFTALMAEAEYDDTAEAAALYAEESGESVENMAAKKVQKAKYAGWYMRTIVSATATNGKVYTHKTAGIFGELKQSRYKKDKHDIPGYGSAILQVVFPQTKWGKNNGDYFSDYRKWTKKKSNQRAVWTFQIKNQHTVDLSHAKINIALEGQQNVSFKRENGVVKYTETNKKPGKRRTLKLVDVDNHKVYGFKKLKNANLNMDGKHTRTFRWVRGKVRAVDFKPLVPASTSQVAAMAVPEFTPALASKTAGKFGLPPQ